MGRTITRRTKSQSEARPELDPLREYEKDSLEYRLAGLFLALRNNLRTVLGVLAALVILLIGAVAYFAWEESRQLAGLFAFEKMLKEPVMNAEGAEKTAISRLDEYLVAHRDAASRRRADIYRINYLRKSGNNAGAAEAALKLALELDSVALRVYFTMLGAYLHEKNGKWPQAGQAFQKALHDITDDGEVKALALLGAGRALQHTGKKQESRASFEKILKMPETAGIDDLRLIALAYLLKAGE